MIKANELRINNYVYDTLGKVNQIDLEAITYIVKEPLNQVQPIPLTEEWLLKFGFDDIKEIDNTDFKEYRLFNNYSICIQFPCGAEAHCYAGNYPIAIEYIHQLQNLYFALTKKELTINLQN